MTEQMRKERSRRRAWWNRWWHRQPRRRRPADPAMSVAAKLLSLLLVLIGRAPVIPVAAPRPVPTPHPLPRRTDLSSPEQIEREHGEGGQIPMSPRPAHRRYHFQPSYARILRDLSRPTPAARADATEALLARVPVEALDWVYMMLQHKDWSALRAVIQPGMSSAEADAALLFAAREAKRREAVEATEEIEEDKVEKGLTR